MYLYFPKTFFWGTGSSCWKNDVYVLGGINLCIWGHPAFGHMCYLSKADSFKGCVLFHLNWSERYTSSMVGGHGLGNIHIPWLQVSTRISLLIQVSSPKATHLPILKSIRHFLDSPLHLAPSLFIPSWNVTPCVPMTTASLTGPPHLALKVGASHPRVILGLFSPWFCTFSPHNLVSFQGSASTPMEAENW